MYKTIFESIRWQAAALGMVPAIFILVLIALVLMLRSQTDQAAAWGAHSDAVLEQSRALQSTFTTANQSGSNYLLKRDPKELARFRRAQYSEQTRSEALV